MNRRLAVLGLAVAMCGTVVAGQTASAPAPLLIPASGDQAPAKPSGAFANTYPVLKPTAPQTQPAPTAPVAIVPMIQTPPTTAPVAITPAPGGFSNAYPRRTQAQQGRTTFRVESVGPQRMRIHVSTDGVEQLTLEASGFIVTTQASGTTITASGPVTMATSDGKTISVEALTLQFAPSGRFSFSASTSPIGNK